MYNEGDKVVYPMYGAGVIVGTEEKILDGCINSYYKMNIPVGNLTILVSVANAEKLGLRPVYEKEEVIRILHSSTELRAIHITENWNLRYKEHLAKIKTGHLIEVLEVYRNLLAREKEKGLSSAEKKMLTTVKQIIISEVILSQDVDKINAEEILADSFQHCYN